MNRERLEKAERYLRDVVEVRQREVGYKAFDMSWWGTNVPVSVAPCGFSGCAIGHLALGGVFGESVKYDKAHTVVLVDGETLYWDSGFHRIADFFGISFEEAKKIFGDEVYDDEELVYLEDWDIDIITPAMVADRIRRLLDSVIETA